MQVTLALSLANDRKYRALKTYKGNELISMLISTNYLSRVAKSLKHTPWTYEFFVTVTHCGDMG